MSLHANIAANVGRLCPLREDAMLGRWLSSEGFRVERMVSRLNFRCDGPPWMASVTALECSFRMALDVLTTRG